ncbi:unnamed protein product [Notodromas monacha]|uniref:FAD-binding PCMH-type domain-containing protein n=1 Tax=Notodromas monacha TaxID=399045 RepID=A0A7R9BYQ6_9CRUS|nr:unnamed protein product [Notodromas monacha]CAG0922743.1 unnamed protein product [Notodromas monacha]
MVSCVDPACLQETSPRTVKHMSVNACLVPLPWIHGQAVTTIEGIGSTRANNLHAVQKQLADSHGTQCGFCTPGFVMSMYTLLRTRAAPTYQDMLAYFQGNLCRCTGYRPILQAYKSFLPDDGGDANGGCCRSSKDTNGCCRGNIPTLQAFPAAAGDDDFSNCCSDGEKSFLPVDESQEPIFPPELLVRQYVSRSWTFIGKRVSWFQPSNSRQLLALKSNYPDGKIVGGNTEIGIDVRQKGAFHAVYINPRWVPETNVLEISLEKGCALVGASVTLSRLRDTLAEFLNSPDISYHQKAGSMNGLVAIVEMLDLFSGQQIRNVATLVGNIVTCSPISDLNPLLAAMGTKLILKSFSSREVVLDSAFFTGYRKNSILPNEVVESIWIPLGTRVSQKNVTEFVKGFKVATRRDDDIAVLNAGFRVVLDSETSDVRHASLWFGGAAAVTKEAESAVTVMIGKKWDLHILDEVIDALGTDIEIPDDAPGVSHSLSNPEEKWSNDEMGLSPLGALKAAQIFPKDAIAQESYFFKEELCNGDISGVMSSAPFVLSGETRVGGQEHFYLEPQASLAIPKGEKGEMEIIATTQWPGLVQEQVADLLDIPSNRVVVKVKRLGGAFGGKELKNYMLALPCALAAQKYNCPVRCVLNRMEDMKATGQRHGYLGKYRVAFNSKGQLLGLDLQLYHNAGYSQDVSVPLRKANLLRTGTKTHYGKVLEDCTLEQCWDECLLQSKFSSRKAEVNSFNKLHDWKKRGISMVPVMFGLAFPGSNLNQAGALVMIYKDGSVLISHAGVEIGQGIHVKLAQIASRVLDIPLESIHTADTATDKIPNATSTAASFTTDLNGPAVKKACEKLVERLRPYKHANPQGGFKDWVQAAYMDRILRTDIVMDIGESLNPAVDIGQIEGAFVQGYGMWMMEDLEFSPSGELRTAGPSNYKIPTSRDVPQEFNVSLLTGSANKHAIYSSKFGLLCWCLLSVSHQVSGRCGVQDGAFVCSNVCDEDVSDSEAFGFGVDFVGRVLDLNGVRFYGLSSVRLYARTRCVGKITPAIRRVVSPWELCGGAADKDPAEVFRTRTSTLLTGTMTVSGTLPGQKVEVSTTELTIKQTSFSIPVVPEVEKTLEKPNAVTVGYSPILTALTMVPEVPLNPTNGSVTFENGTAKRTGELESMQQIDVSDQGNDDIGYLSQFKAQTKSSDPMIYNIVI